MVVSADYDSQNKYSDQEPAASKIKRQRWFNPWEKGRKLKLVYNKISNNNQIPVTTKA